MASIIRSSTATSSSASGNELTFSHTITHSRGLLLVVGAKLNDNVGSVGSATFNGVAMTAMDDYILTSDPPYIAMRGFYMLNPPVGTYNVVVGASGVGGETAGIAASYRNVSSSGPDATDPAVDKVEAGNSTESITTVADRAWAFMVIGTHVSGGLTVTDSATEHTSALFVVVAQNFYLYIWDTNSDVTPAGSVTFGYDRLGGNQHVIHQMISFAHGSGLPSTIFF